MQRIVIFGATSSIASSCARLWVAKGSHLFLVGRSQQKLDALISDLRVRADTEQVITGTTADLDDIQQHELLLEKAYLALGGIDITLIAHGSLPVQEACQQSVEMTLRQFQTNAISAISLLTLLANRYEGQGSGVIAVISSVAGDRGRQSNYVYGAAKGTLTIFLQGLRNRLARTGVAVVTIKPGFVDTPMTANFEKKGGLWVQPETVAEGILNGIEKRRSVVYLPGIWRWIMLIILHIPEVIFKRLSL